MKAKNFIFSIIVAIACFNLTSIFSQEITNKNDFIINKYFQLNNNPSLVLENDATSINQSLKSSYIILNQTGNFNQVDLKTNLNDSQTVNQFGNKNNYTFINYYNNNPSNFNILQQGTSNFLQIYGQNSIINNISIIQKSNFKTIQIINY